MERASNHEITDVEIEWLLYKAKRIRPQYLEQKKQEAKSSNFLEKLFGIFPKKSSKELKKIDLNDIRTKQLSSPPENKKSDEACFVELLLELKKQLQASPFYKEIEEKYYEQNPDACVIKNLIRDKFTETSSSSETRDARLALADITNELNNKVIDELNICANKFPQPHNYTRHICQLLYQMNQHIILRHAFTDDNLKLILAWAALPYTLVQGPRYQKFDAVSIPNSRLGILKEQIEKLDNYQDLKDFIKHVQAFIDHRLLTTNEAISEIGTMLQEISSMEDTEKKPADVQLISNKDVIEQKKEITNMSPTDILRSLEDARSIARS